MAKGMSGLRGYGALAVAHVHRAMLGFKIVEVESTMSPGNFVIAASQLNEGEKGLETGAPWCFIGANFLGGTDPLITLGNVQGRAIGPKFASGHFEHETIGDDLSKTGSYTKTIEANYILVPKEGFILGKFDEMSFFKPSSGNIYWKLLIGRI